MINELTRKILVYFLSGVMPYYVINEFPKSGGTWLGLMLSELLGVPFPRNKFPVFQPSILHGHYLKYKKIKNSIVVWRDGRDVMVSWYHHCLFKNEIGNHALVDKVSSELNFHAVSSVKKNLPRFIDYSFSEQRHPSFSWSRFVNDWLNQQDVIYINYENLLTNTSQELKRILTELTSVDIDPALIDFVVNKYSFANMAKRKSGQENKSSFIRKGVIGDWKNYFSREAGEKFLHYAGQELIQLGYELSNDWISDLK